jgi:hypothetical protein
MPTVYLALLIPLIATAIFYFIKKSEFAWWEFFVPFLSVLVAIVIAKALTDSASVRFDEYWGSTVTAVYEEEPYNYWHNETCTRTYACGTDKDGNTEYCTETYDCSHQDDVGPSWWAETNLGEKFGISEQEYDKLAVQFKTARQIVGSHDNYSPRDKCVGSSGTKFEGKRVGQISYDYQNSWNGDDNTRKAYVSQHTYINKVKATDLSIFNIKIVKEAEADSMGLYKYPEYDGGGIFRQTKGLEYPTILGGNISEQTQEKFKRLNGKFGVTNEMRLWILIFENKPMSIANYQENYWVKGNMNELVVCIGKKGDEIQWSHAFSWAHSDILTTEVKNEVLNLYTYKDSVIKIAPPKVLPVGKKLQKKILGKAGEKLPPNVIPLPTQAAKDSIIKVKSFYPILNEQTLNDYYNYLNQNLNKFQRRSFKEFDYLTVEPKTGAVILIYVLALLISVGVNLWVITNEFWGEEGIEINWNRLKFWKRQ